MRGLILPLVLGSIVAAPLHAQERAERVFPIKLESMDQLVRMKECQLIELYKASEPGPVPTCFTPGFIILNPGMPWTKPMARLFSLGAWQGKHFPDGSTMWNGSFGGKIIPAGIVPGVSMLDGKPSTVFDYALRSPLVGRYRDEMREVSPGIYLGVMYRREDCCKARVSWFTIDSRGRTQSPVCCER